MRKLAYHYYICFLSRVKQKFGGLEGIYFVELGWAGSPVLGQRKWVLPQVRQYTTRLTGQAGIRGFEGNQQ